MNFFEHLMSLTGTWTGTNKLFLQEDSSASESQSSAQLNAIILGKFLRWEYDWWFDGQHQEGTFIIGVEDESEKMFVHWLDSFHMGNKVMVCTDATGSNSRTSVFGTYSFPGQPDWGWRTEFDYADNLLSFIMYNVTPDGKEVLAVESSFRRSAAAND